MSRLDVFVGEKFGITRSMAGGSIKNGQIMVNGSIVKKPSYTVDYRDDVRWIRPEFEVPILYEDENLYVIHKPAGISVERTYSTPAYEKVLKDYVNFSFYDLVNRLDKPTSGIMILPKTARIYYNLKQQFRNHSVYKYYWAYFSEPIVEPKISDFSQIICDHGYMCFVYGDKCYCEKPNLLLHEKILDDGKYMKTFYEKVEDNNFYKCYPVTGRTHQIRLMMEDLGVPIVKINGSNSSAIGLFSVGISYKLHEL